jgi:hypothetical protein
VDWIYADQDTVQWGILLNTIGPWGFLKGSEFLGHLSDFELHEKNSDP